MSLLHLLVFIVCVCVHRFVPHASSALGVAPRQVATAFNFVDVLTLRCWMLWMFNMQECSTCAFMLVAE